MPRRPSASWWGASTPCPAAPSDVPVELPDLITVTALGPDPSMPMALPEEEVHAPTEAERAVSEPPATI